MAVTLLLLCMAVASCGGDNDDGIISGGGIIQVDEDELNIMNLNGSELKFGDAAFFEYGTVGSGIDFGVVMCSDEM